MKETSLERPFFWGVASSAFQYEGQIDNDMTRWEAAGGFRQNGSDPRYERANDHWSRWPDDYRLLGDLGVNAYRLSLEWSRVEPEPGKFAEAALDQYEAQIDRLLELGIEPMVTFHHFTHPPWFHEHSPWHSDESVRVFARYVAKVMDRLGDRVRHYVTLNEPMTWALAAYADARFPPGRRDLGTMMQVVARLLLAHREAYDIVHAKRPDAQVGIAHSCVTFAPERAWHVLDRGLASRIDFFFNRMLPDAVRSNRLAIHFPTLVDFDAELPLNDQVDFWGVNYYYRLHVRFKFRLSQPFALTFINRRGLGTTDLGWEIYPEGLEASVRALASYGKPVCITENGIASADDAIRRQYLERHLEAVDGLRNSAVPLFGYFYWSLLDNYEWLVGRRARFGLYKVHYNNGLERELRPSGQYFSNEIKRRLAPKQAP